MIVGARRRLRTIQTDRRRFVRRLKGVIIILLLSRLLYTQIECTLGIAQRLLHRHHHQTLLRHEIRRLGLGVRRSRRTRRYRCLHLTCFIECMRIIIDSRVWNLFLFMVQDFLLYAVLMNELKTLQVFRD